MRVIVDIVPNHSSDQHVWFQEALAAAPGSAERARYLFRDGQGEHGDIPPNNWESVFGGPAWTRTTNADGTPGQWYLHLFDASQPDLDWTNPWVREQFVGVLRFWLDRGVDGFRVDVAHGMIKAAGMPDWTAPADAGSMGGGLVDATSLEPGISDEGDQLTPPFWAQPEVHEIYREWHRVLEEYPGDQALIAEAWVEPLSKLALLGAPRRDAAGVQLLLPRDAVAGARAQAHHRRIDRGVRRGRRAEHVGAQQPRRRAARDPARARGRAPPGRRRGACVDRPSACRRTGCGGRAPRHPSCSHCPAAPTSTRARSSACPRSSTCQTTPGRTRPGSAPTASATAVMDAACPIPWESDRPSYGFGPSANSWLPQPPEWAHLARDAQIGVPGSTLELYTDALRLRREHDLGLGSIEWLPGYGDGVLAFVNNGVTVIANAGTVPVELPVGDIVLASETITGGVLPADTTVWLILSPDAA